VYVTKLKHTELLHQPCLHTNDKYNNVSRYWKPGRHRKQRYGKSWLCYSNHIKTSL